MKIFIAIVLLAPLFAQSPVPGTEPSTAPSIAPPTARSAATPVPDDEQWLTGSIDLGYRWRTGVAGSFETYRSVVNLGSGPKLLGTEFTMIDPKKRLFDRLEVRAYDWGGDPYSTLHVNAKKSRLYEFNAEYRNIAYFNNLPSFADPLFARGIVLNEQSFDTHRRFTSLQLDLLPGNWFIPYLAFDRDADTGTGVNAFVTGGNEYAVPTKIRNSVNTYRGGVRLELHRFHVTVEQGGTTFKDDQNVYSTSGTNFGNNSTPLIGQTLNLTGLSQAYGIRGTGVYTKGMATANPFSWLDLYGQILYGNSNNQVHYRDYETGNLADISQLLFYTSQQYLLSAEAKLPHTSASVGAEFRPLQRVRILQSWLTDRLSGSSSATSTGTNTAAGLRLGNSLASNYNQEQVDILWDIFPKMTLRGGYRYVWGDASDVILPLSELTGFERGRLRQNTGIAGVNYRASQKLSLNGLVESSRSGGTYFRTSLYNYQKVRMQARYKITPSLQLAGDVNLLKNQNPTAGSHYDYSGHQESLSVTWSPTALKSLSFQGNYTRSTVRSTISYLIPQTLTPELDAYRENGHIVSILLDGNLKAFGKIAKLSGGGSFVISSGSRPTSYFQPFLKVVVPVNKQLAWVSEWHYYGFAESFFIFENFRTNLFTTGVRFTR